MERRIVLSHSQAALLLEAKQEGKGSVTVSPDLGLTTLEVALSPRGILFPGGEQTKWESVDRIATSNQQCFIVAGGEINAIKVFSEYTNKLYSLFSTTGAPTMLISGIPMHRIKGTEPHRDTLEKIKAITPVVGRVLDTATGLGYTAIEAARTAEQVLTIEFDPAVLEVARLNPWSQALFGNPRIVQVIGDSFEKVQELEDETFSRIIHDPPTFSLAGELYSGTFYRDLNRVLKNRGRLFHYIGDPDSKSGRNTTKSVVRRLYEAGFSQVYPKREAFGVVALK